MQWTSLSGSVTMETVFTNGRSPRMGATPSRNKCVQQGRKQAAHSFSHWHVFLCVSRQSTSSSTPNEVSLGTAWRKVCYKITHKHYSALWAKCFFVPDCKLSSLCTLPLTQQCLIRDDLMRNRLMTEHRIYPVFVVCSSLNTLLTIRRKRNFG